MFDLKKIVLLISVILSASVIFSCSGEKGRKFERENESEERKILIGFSADSLATERWKRDLDVFISEAKDWGANVIVQNAGNDVDVQIEQLEYLASKNVDVIVILPKQADAFTEEIQKLRNRGIPVISYDRLILNANISLYVTVDAEKVGYLTGLEMLKRTKSKNWYRMMGPLDDYNVHLFMRGLDKAVASEGIGFSGTSYTANWNYDFSGNKMKDIILSGLYPEVVICGNDSLANSVIQAYREFAGDKKVYVAGQDCDVVACQNIINGYQEFTIYKPIISLAQEAARYAVLIAKDYEKIAHVPHNLTIDNGYGQIPYANLEPVVVDKTNMEQVVIKSGFHSASDIYRK